MRRLYKTGQSNIKFIFWICFHFVVCFENQFILRTVIFQHFQFISEYINRKVHSSPFFIKIKFLERTDLFFSKYCRCFGFDNSFCSFDGFRDYRNARCFLRRKIGRYGFFFLSCNSLIIFLFIALPKLNNVS